MHKKFRELGGGRFTDRQMSNKLQTLKKRFKRWMDLQKYTGLGRDKTTGGVAADQELLEAIDDTENALDNQVLPFR